MQRRTSWFGIGLGAWLLGEVAAFAIVVHLVGLAGAILIGLLTSLAGASMLRRVGLAAAGNLRRVMAGAPSAAPLQQATMVDGTLSALAAVLLILPGFLSDAVGFVLAAPAVRQWVGGRFGGESAGSGSSARRQTPDVIDLAPQDWRRVDEPR